MKPAQNSHSGGSGQVTPGRRVRPAIRRQAAVEWLTAYLADAPRSVQEVHTAGRDAGFAKGLLRLAEREMGIVKYGGRNALWALPGTPPPQVEQRECSKCGVVKPLYDFPVHARAAGGRGRECLPCDRARKRRSELRVADPGLVAAEEADQAAPDPHPARALRHELARLRRAGEGFEEAWDQAQKTILAGLDQGEAAEWRAAFSATRAAWMDGFERTGSGALAGLATELSAA